MKRKLLALVSVLSLGLPAFANLETVDQADLQAVLAIQEEDGQLTRITEPQQLSQGQVDIKVPDELAHGDRPVFVVVEGQSPDGENIEMMTCAPPNGGKVEISPESHIMGTAALTIFDEDASADQLAKFIKEMSKIFKHFEEDLDAAENIDEAETILKDAMNVQAPELLDAMLKAGVNHIPFEEMVEKAFTAGTLPEFSVLGEAPPDLELEAGAPTGLLPENHPRAPKGFDLNEALGRNDLLPPGSLKGKIGKGDRHFPPLEHLEGFEYPDEVQFLAGAEIDFPIDHLPGAHLPDLAQLGPNFRPPEFTDGRKFPIPPSAMFHDDLSLSGFDFEFKDPETHGHPIPGFAKFGDTIGIHPDFAAKEGFQLPPDLDIEALPPIGHRPEDGRGPRRPGKKGPDFIGFDIPDFNPNDIDFNQINPDEFFTGFNPELAGVEIPEDRKQDFGLDKFDDKGIGFERFTDKDHPDFIPPHEIDPNFDRKDHFGHLPHHGDGFFNPDDFFGTKGGPRGKDGNQPPPPNGDQPPFPDDKEPPPNGDQPPPPDGTNPPPPDDTTKVDPKSVDEGGKNDTRPIGVLVEADNETEVEPGKILDLELEHSEGTKGKKKITAERGVYRTEKPKTKDGMFDLGLIVAPDLEKDSVDLHVNVGNEIENFELKIEEQVEPTLLAGQISKSKIELSTVGTTVNFSRDEVAGYLLPDRTSEDGLERAIPIKGKVFDSETDASASVIVFNRPKGIKPGLKYTATFQDGEDTFYAYVIDDSKPKEAVIEVRVVAPGGKLE